MWRRTTQGVLTLWIASAVVGLIMGGIIGRRDQGRAAVGGSALANSGEARPALPGGMAGTGDQTAIVIPPGVYVAADGVALYVGVTPAPPATATPTEEPTTAPTRALETATPTNTATPTATPTKTPTEAPTTAPTAPPVDPPTPTREVTPPPTPGDPGDPYGLKHCLVEVEADRLNVRVWPEIVSDNYKTGGDGKRIQFVKGYRAQVVTLFRAPGELWGLTTEGWIAMEYQGATYAREVPNVDPRDGIPCADLPASTYERSTLLGFHLIYTANLSTVGPLYAALNGRAGTIKEAPLGGTMHIGPAVKGAGLAKVGIARIAGLADCPPGWGAGNPEAVADQWWSVQWYGVNGVAGLREAGWADYNEINNECNHRAPTEWQARYYKRMIEHANEAGRCLLIGSWYGGTPEVEMWADPAWQRLLDWLVANPCRVEPDGTVIRNGIAFHNYPGNRPGEPVDLTNIWYYARFTQFERVQKPIHQLIPVYFTEQGILGEDRGTIPDCTYTIREHKRMIDGYRRHPWIVGTALWSLGGGTEWADLGQCQAEIERQF